MDVREMKNENWLNKLEEAKIKGSRERDLLMKQKIILANI